MQEELVKRGWQLFNTHLKPNNCTGYYKSFTNHETCNFNKRDVKQVEIYIHTDSKLGDYVEVECCGQLKDESWVRFTVLGIKDNSIDNIELKVEEVLRVWDFAVSQAQ